ncbi:TaqI-like C-terminal specificity domain-containing protein [Aneurinibacillus sp. Ricciae_BoGa-3]|uniref:Eco57I restriction-modification methylase domain-containing protein n=1 Tax=Aneurinibacillus sp. Ricciae_BoGa-3 TaxID=3022697 RepID=UPI0023406A39|nr:TaqI-like C-terminal specificity domain-containing protein [Aneurinibacillus sp. Ricciae_BoGa-3]WCK55480.1 TaqI-like C-terminal specificity domain-containing protein [Aneurinibacillus sp. Ricciae_BoGa-3]
MCTVTGYENIFTRAFDLVEYGKFIQHAFLRANERKYESAHFDMPFRFGQMFVTNYGSYEDEKNKCIAFLAVSFNKTATGCVTREIERASLHSYMRKCGYDAAIIAFYKLEEKRWRFSLVRFALTYDKTERIKRDSFIGGEAASHLVIKKQLLSIREGGESILSLDKLEKAFTANTIIKDYMASGVGTPDNFNFTMYEEEPCDKEAAVTPGMLGAVFEKHMDTALRKSRGTFYTSCEIVQYMCRESVVHYLAAQTGLGSKQIRAFICCDYPSFDAVPVEVEHKIEELHNALKRLKVLDPAAGSGAYIIGMLDEIVKARLHISYLSHLNIEVVRRQSDEWYLEFLQDALCAVVGVDIEQQALEIVVRRVRSFCRTLIHDAAAIDVGELAVRLICGDGLLDEIEGEFDIVIGNPPYGIVYDTTIKKEYESLYPSFKRNHDLYTAFYERAIRLLKNNGTLHYITPNTFLNGDYFKPLRTYITSSCRVLQLINFNDHQVFDDPTVFVSILLARKEENIERGEAYLYNHYSFMGKEKGFSFSRQTAVYSSDKPLRPGSSIMESIINKPLVVPLESMFYVKDVGFNYWTKGKGKKRQGSIGSRIFYQGDRKDERDIPYLKGRNVSRYAIATPQQYMRHNYETFLDKATDTFRYSEALLTASPKIVYRQTSDRIVAAIDYSRHYVDKTVHIILPKQTSWSMDPQYLLALLNSQLFFYIYREISQERYGRAFTQVKTVYIKQLPLKIADKDEQQVFIQLVEQIRSLTEKAVTGDKQATEQIEELQRKLDGLIYRLYGLSESEIEKVEAL